MNVRAVAWITFWIGCAGGSSSDAGSPNGSPEAPQVVTWLYTRDLLKASEFLANAVGLDEVFDGGATEWEGCKVHAGSSRSWFLGVCDIRNAPTSMDEASLTITLVTGDGRAGVDRWHAHLKNSGSRINVTTPAHSLACNCFSFNFSDVDAISLGNYRFEVQAFEDPAWPRPPATLALAGSAPPAPQQVTWTYTADLPAATEFLVRTLGLPMVLDQGQCTIHGVVRSSAFLGVCNSRPAPKATPPVTYTLVARSDTGVRDWHALVSARNATNATAAALVERFNVYAFEFRDWKRGVLGWYRLSCQNFEDPMWPRAQP